MKKRFARTKLADLGRKRIESAKTRRRNRPVLRTNTAVGRLREPVFWVVGRYNGREVLLGPCNSTEEANEKGMDTFSGIFEIKVYRTKDINKASQMHKAARPSGYTIDDRMQRVKRKL